MFNLILSKYIYFIYLFIVFHSTFRNISAISWRPVLVVEEAGVPEKNHYHGQATGYKLLTLASRVHPFCNLQCRARIHAVGLYELLVIQLLNG
jgi:hypothetical protein